MENGIVTKTGRRELIMCMSSECKYEDPKTGKCTFRMSGKIFETMPKDAICVHKSELFNTYLEYKYYDKERG
jgi:hypothetical protein